MARALVPPRRDEPEYLDAPSLVLPDLPGNLRDLRLLNRWFGGTAPVLRRLRPFITAGDAVSILDVGTGSGDIPLAAVRLGHRRNTPVRAVGLDVSPEVLDEARRCLSAGEVDLVLGDARSLPFADRSFDLVTCCLTLHHFVPEEAERVLREMWRVARHAVLVADLERSYLAYIGTWLATRTVARNRLTRHDGPLSTLRAYTPSELTHLAHSAGWTDPRLHRHLFFRQIVVARHARAAH